MLHVQRTVPVNVSPARVLVRAGSAVPTPDYPCSWSAPGSLPVTHRLALRCCRFRNIMWQGPCRALSLLPGVRVTHRIIVIRPPTPAHRLPGAARCGHSLRLMCFPAGQRLVVSVVFAEESNRCVCVHVCISQAAGTWTCIVGDGFYKNLEMLPEVLSVAHLRAAVLEHAHSPPTSPALGFDPLTSAVPPRVCGHLLGALFLISLVVTLSTFWCVCVLPEHVPILRGFPEVSPGRTQAHASCV